MKKLLLTTLVALATTIAATAQVNFEWGTATWSIEDGHVFEDLSEVQLSGITLSYPNPSNYALTFFNMLVVPYDLYIDDATEPIQEAASVQMGTDVNFAEDRYTHEFVEGHTYRIVTRGAVLGQANLVTYSTDTISVNDDSYTISFSIKGPELVKTIDVEGTMALSITSQDIDLTYSLIDTKEVCGALGIADIKEAAVWGLNVNGSYNPYYREPFDGWRDADGEYTVWGGNAYSQLGHNAYPAVYCIKLNETCDSITYFFYDYWREYDPEEADSIGGGGIIQQAPRRAPETNYQRIIWDWDNGDGTITQYTRSFRVEEGHDYNAAFAIIANKKMVRINATLHFVSQEEYAALHQTEETGYYLVSDLTNWSTTDQSYAFTKLDDGKTWQITISGDRAIYAKIAPASAFADQDNFWSLLLSAPSDAYTELTGSMVVNGGAWYLGVANTKEYTISIVPSEMTFEITVTPNDDPIEPQGPQAPFYLVGGITNWGFDATRVFEAQADGQSYAITFPAVYDGDGKSWFKIAPANAISDGAIIWGNMLCAPSDGDSSLSGTMVVGDAGAWCLSQKEAIESYTITIVPSTLAYTIKENTSNHVADILLDTTPHHYYNMSGQRVSKPRRGLNIVDTQKGYRKVFVEE